MINLRPATIEESEFLLELRNDPLVRENSFSHEIITPAKHEQWLKKILSGNKHQLFVILDEQNNPIGQVRFDLHKEWAEINVALSASARGRGYGKEAVRIGSKLFLENNPQKRLLAKIKVNNNASLKVFLSIGYKEKKRVKGIVFLTLTKNN